MALWVLRRAVAAVPAVRHLLQQKVLGCFRFEDVVRWSRIRNTACTALICTKRQHTCCSSCSCCLLLLKLLMLLLLLRPRCCHHELERVDRCVATQHRMIVQFLAS